VSSLDISGEASPWIPDGAEGLPLFSLDSSHMCMFVCLLSRVRRRLRGVERGVRPLRPARPGGVSC
jgi:hypothetical protein